MSWPTAIAGGAVGGAIVSLFGLTREGTVVTIKLPDQYFVGLLVWRYADLVLTPVVDLYECPVGRKARVRYVFIHTTTGPTYCRITYRIRKANLFNPGFAASMYAQTPLLPAAFNTMNCHAGIGVDYAFYNDGANSFTAFMPLPDIWFESGDVLAIQDVAAGTATVNEVQVMVEESDI